MSLRLHTFDAWARSYVLLTAPSYSALSALLHAVEEADHDWAVDLDPRWREVLLYSADPDARAPAESLVAAAGVEIPLEQEGPFRVETPRERAEGSAIRTSRPGQPKSKTEIIVRVAPADPKADVTCSGIDDASAPVVEHGLRRAARRGPSRGYPLAAAELHAEVTVTGPTPLGVLADLHAATQQAAARAITTAGTAILTPDTRLPDGEPPVLHDLETSIADVFLNLRALSTYPVEAVDESDRSQLGAFIAYQASLLYGHTLDDRMRRVPATPPQGLHHFLGRLTLDLLDHCAEHGAGGEMVGDLVRTWTAAWRSAEDGEA